MDDYKQRSFTMPRRGENIYKRKDGRWEGRLLKKDGKYQYLDIEHAFQRKIFEEFEIK